MPGRAKGPVRLTFTSALENTERMCAGGIWLEGGSQEKESLHWRDGGPGWRPCVVGGRTELCQE